jgi:addiction module RelE/StbE family toxin
MITVNFNRNFLKSYGKRIKHNKKLKLQVTNRIDIFKIDRSSTILNDHSLIGDRQGLRSFSVTGDIRIIYRLVSEDFAEFIDIGSHNQVY